MTGIDYAIIAVFLLVTAMAGLAISRLIRDSDDFFVAGRELTPFILGATITATNLSVLHFVGFAGTSSQNGISIIWQNWTGCMTIILSGMFVLPVMRRLRIRSVPEFLQLRYSKPLRIIAAAFWGFRLCMFLGIVLYTASTAAVIITGWHNYVAWLFIFSMVSILYSVIGGAWAVAVMDSVQFCVMLLGAMIILPVAMYAAGGIPALAHFLRSQPSTEHYFTLVPRDGEFNWLFILAITLLSCKWATIDQSILQRAFGARSPRDGAKGMVLAGIIATPLAFFYILPGMAIAKLHPAKFDNPDFAMPWLLAHVIPSVSRGLLGLVLCGLLAAQVSVLTSDINSVATLFTSDVYRNMFAVEPSQRRMLIVVRISSLVCGAIMLMVAYGLSHTNVGAVRANLVVVGILDMPLFVITVIYGLLWRRANWQGATAGFIAGGLMGVACYFLITPSYYDAYTHHWSLGTLDGLHNQIKSWDRWQRSIAPIVSTSTALIVTPIVSLLTRRNELASIDRIRAAVDVGGDAPADAHPVGLPEDTFHLIPRSAVGRFGMALALGGFALFLSGVACGSQAMPIASLLAVAGMLSVFAGGLIRVHAE